MGWLVYGYHVHKLAHEPVELNIGPAQIQLRVDNYGKLRVAFKNFQVTRQAEDRSIVFLDIKENLDDQGSKT